MSNQSYSVPAYSFEPPETVTSMTSTPRFGHGSDFQALFSDDSEVQRSYVIGVTIAGIICCSVFVIWGILLIVFMCCGSDNVGFLSGRPFRHLVTSSSTPTSSPTSTKSGISSKKQPSARRARDGNDEDDMDDFGDLDHKRSWSSRDSSDNATSSSPPRNPTCSNRPTRVRVAFLLCGAIFVTFSVLVVTQGLSNLQSTVAVMQGSNKEVLSISTAAVDILENGFLRAGQVAETVRNELDEQLSNGTFCPADPSLENSEEGQQLRTEATKALAQLDELGDFMTTSVQRLVGPLKRFVIESAYIDEKLEPIDLTDWRAMLVLIPFSIVPALLMGATLMALFDASIPAFICFTDWFLMPLFILLVVFAWVLASATIIMAGLNGDFCLPSGYYEGNPPDGTIREILNAEGYGNTTAYEIADFYVAQCRKEDPFDFIYEAQPQLQEAEINILNIAKLLVAPNFLSTLSLYCNRDYSGLQEMVSNMDTLIVLLVDAIARTLQLIRCDRIVPLYTETIYQGVCTYSPSAVFWVFSSCLIMGFTGMLMITFRSSYKMTEYVYDVQDDDDGLVLQDEDEIDEYESPRSATASSRPSSSNRFNGSSDDDDNFDNEQQDPDDRRNDSNVYSHNYMNDDDNDQTYDYERQRQKQRQEQADPYYSD